MDNTTVVFYINEEGVMISGSLCFLLVRLLSWCNLSQIVLRARHIPGYLNMIADKLSRHWQVIKMEWSDLQEVFDHLWSRWQTPPVDLFATRFNNKLSKFLSPVLDQKARKVDVLSLHCEGLDAYAFPAVSILGQAVSKLVDQSCWRMVLIAPGWPNMPWFWDVVGLLVQIPPFCHNWGTCWPSLSVSVHTGTSRTWIYMRGSSSHKHPTTSVLWGSGSKNWGLCLSNDASQTSWTSCHLL